MEVLAQDARSGLSGQSASGQRRATRVPEIRPPGQSGWWCGGVVVWWRGGVRVVRVRVCSIGELLLFLHMMLVMRDGAGAACLAAPIL